MHCHIHQTPETISSLSIKDGRAIVYCTQATKYTDWRNVSELCDRCKGSIIPAFGIHPWFAGSAAGIPETWPNELEQIIRRRGGIVGECGLDKAARDPATKQLYPFEPQIKVLNTQLAIAHKLNVPISLHCVRAFGAMAEMLQRAIATHTAPPAIMLHSYSGSPDMLKQIFLKGELGARIYVSFSYFVNRRNTAKSQQCIQAIPEDRILVESDLSDVSDAQEALERVIDMVAQARSWSAAETRSKLAANSRRFFRR